MDLKFVFLVVLLETSSVRGAEQSCEATKGDYATKEDIKELKTLLNSVLTALEIGKKEQHSNKADNGDTKPRDCQEIHNKGHSTTDVYTIYPEPEANGISVRCDMDTTSGGWTVIQRRISSSDFYKNWSEYEKGFGDLYSNFWLGNRYIHRISNQNRYSLRVDLTSMNGEEAYAEYRDFFVGDAASGYKLSVHGYSGTAGDSLTSNGDGMKFSAYDRDNDSANDHCAVLYHGAWWYTDCHSSNLNGDYGSKAYAKGPIWEPWKGYFSPMKITEMKIRRFK